MIKPQATLLYKLIMLLRDNFTKELFHGHFPIIPCEMPCQNNAVVTT